MRVRLIAATVAAAVLAVSGLVMAGAAPAAAADQIWYQAVGSPSESAPCPTSDPADLAAGWTEWVKGYEMWPNAGTGGWTCGRSILWAKGSPPPSAGVGCVQVQESPADAAWMNFGSAYFLPVGSDAWRDPGCSVFFDFTVVAVVYATTIDEANARCEAGLPGSSARTGLGISANIYMCEL